MKILIVVDMQNDFITGTLGSADAVKIVPAVVEKVKNFDGKVIFTRDTHFEDYMSTQEGEKLPVKHCIKDTDGWQICDELQPYANEVVDKITFGSVNLPKVIEELTDHIDEIELCGVCTVVCVVSNAICLKAELPNTVIKVDSNCCAGTSVEAHNAALKTMNSCQIDII